jgi:hypothetical protein
MDALVFVPTASAADGGIKLRKEGNKGVYQNFPVPAFSPHSGQNFDFFGAVLLTPVMVRPSSFLASLANTEGVFSGVASGFHSALVAVSQSVHTTEP